MGLLSEQAEVKLHNELRKRYSKITNKGTRAISSNNEFLDKYLRNPSCDKRMGLTLLVRLDRKILDNIQVVLRKLSRIEPYQYYYPVTDLHITLMDLIGAKEGFVYKREVLQSYKQMLKAVLPNVPSFEVSFDGATISDGAVILKGYYSHGLLFLRDSIRRFAKLHDIPLEERYPSFTAHVTIVRFREKMRRRNLYLNEIERLENRHFGKMDVKQTEFVYHDWYNLSYKTKLLGTYNLSH